jgi:hypothetical protein
MDTPDDKKPGEAATRREHPPIDDAPIRVARSIAARSDLDRTSAQPVADVSRVAIHEAAHASVARLLGFEIEAVSVRRGVTFAGVTIAGGMRVDPSGLRSIPWWRHPDREIVVKKLMYLLSGNAAEAFAAGTSRAPTPNADDARAAFAALPETTRSRLVKAERAESDCVPDAAAAWALTVAFTPHARLFFDLLAVETRAMVRDRLPAIASVARELDRGAVLTGAAVDVILAVGEVVEADDGPPVAGRWIAITSFATGEIHAQVGEILPFHDARVQAVPELFLPSDSPEADVAKAIEDYRRKSMSPTSSRDLAPGPRVVRCTRRLVGRTRGGWTAIRIAAGQLAPATAWYVTRWPSYFEPSVG